MPPCMPACGLCEWLDGCESVRHVGRGCLLESAHLISPYMGQSQLTALAPLQALQNASNRLDMGTGWS